MYAVVAPGFSSICVVWKDVERIHALYPYAKWMKCNTEQEAREFIKRNSNKHVVKQLYNYGDTLDDLYINVKYRIMPDCIFYVLDTKRIGNLRLEEVDGNIIEYKGSKIYIRTNNIFLSDKTIAGHMSAIHNLLLLIGDYIDVNIELPNFSVYYALCYYNKGRVRAISITQDLIKKRLCKVAYTLRMKNIGDNLEGE